ncbi:adenosylcobinamide amidohydrolase [Natrinema sp. SYSU A 869]|uniref:adenosylcobinamide amidohydrolase n=1 Tax=Natrinema sp. SYSU A 869 TaxID=2871694 RepID=UPI001CA39D8D|nr:adenosylcobinamide amidohydrolase [Natrinema sp. SYSU A 869]
MTEPDPNYEAIRRDGALRVRRPDTEWLSTGWNGGRRMADAAYNISVPEGWDRTDLGVYIDDRLERAGFKTAAETAAGPALLTGVDIADARGARRGSVTAYATAGISNPAALPMEPTPTDESDSAGVESDDSGLDQGRGTVNVIVGTTQALEPGALENLIAVAAEAKAATLLAETGFPGTTTDAVIVGHDPSGSPAAFSGSGTEVGAATRACVRDAVRASLRAHYATADADLPASVDDATDGVSTDGQADVFQPTLATDRSEPDS